MMSVASKYMAIVFPFILLLFYAIQHFYLRTSRQMRLLDIEYKAPLYSQMIETLNGLPTIRAFKWEREAEKTFWRALDDSQRPYYLLVCLQRWLTFSIDLMIAFMAFILITVTTTLREEVGPGYIGIALTNILGFSGVMKSAITTWVSLEISIGAVARIKNFVAEVKPEGDGDQIMIEPPKSWPQEGTVEFQNLTASYP